MSAASPSSLPRTRALLHARAAVPAALGLLSALSVWLRTVELDTGYWIDEGLSIGIADRPIGDIPETLRLDGSPPLYYLLLHLWLRLTGDPGEEATHALSLVFATLAIPVAWALATRLFGTAAGWIAAVLFAFNPFLTAYAQETRMYSLIVLVGTVMVATFVGAFVQRRGRAWLAGFVVSSAVLLYTHNWAFFLGAALAVAWVVLVALAPRPERRALVRDGLIAAAAIAVAYAPWVPSMLFQAAHTGAPWALAPDLSSLRSAFGWLLGPEAEYVLLLGAGTGLFAIVARRDEEARAVAVLALGGAGTILVAWIASQLNPAWANRYLAVALPALLLLAAIGLARARGVGIAALLLVTAIWAGDNGPDSKSNARELARAIAPGLGPGDLVISGQPEQIPVLHHYLRDVDGLRWATLTGPVTDLGVTDWRDGAERLEAADPQRHLVPLLDEVEPGHRVAFIEPEILDVRRWSAPWTSAVRERSARWQQVLRADDRFRVVAELPQVFTTYRNPIRATVLVREPIR